MKQFIFINERQRNQDWFFFINASFSHTCLSLNSILHGLFILFYFKWDSLIFIFYPTIFLNQMSESCHFEYSFDLAFNVLPNLDKFIQLSDCVQNQFSMGDHSTFIVTLAKSMSHVSKHSF